MNCTPYARDRGGCEARTGMCGSMLCANCSWEVRDICWGWKFVPYALENLESILGVLICMLEAVEGNLCSLEVTR